MDDFELDNNQRPLTEAFHSDVADAVEKYRWNVGGTSEDPIMANICRTTPTVVSEILYAWLDEHDKVVCPHGLVDKEQIVYRHLKSQVMSVAQEHLEDEVLLPNGETVPMEDVRIE